MKKAGGEAQLSFTGEAQFNLRDTAVAQDEKKTFCKEEP